MGKILSTNSSQNRVQANYMGKSTMTWGAEKPNNSNLAYQIKLVAGDPEVSVPEPATLSVFSLGLVGLLASRKRRQS